MTIDATPDQTWPPPEPIDLVQRMRILDPSLGELASDAFAMFEELVGARRSPLMELLAAAQWNNPRATHLLSPTTVHYRNEAEFRDGVGTAAYLMGWDVATEVQIRDGNRVVGCIDLAIWSPLYLGVFELKTKVASARALRFGLQQIDSYRRLFPDVDAFWVLAAGDCTYRSQPIESGYVPQVFNSDELMGGITRLDAGSRLSQAQLRGTQQTLTHQAAMNFLQYTEGAAADDIADQDKVVGLEPSVDSQ